MGRADKNTVGLIGAGNMGSALLSGLSAAEGIATLCFDVDEEKRRNASKDFGAVETGSSRELVSRSDIVIIAVKPDVVAAVLAEITGVSAEKIIVSIAAGITLQVLRERLGPSPRIFRVMPNTPGLKGHGMTVISTDQRSDEVSIKKVEAVFSTIGRVMVLPEKLMDAVTGLSGSGPAYVYTFIQALSDGGVKMGIPRAQALLLAAQTVMGAAHMVIETGEDPMVLRGKVTSPGGTTIEGVHVLEKSGFTGIVMDAVEAAALKSRKLGEKK